MPATVPFEQIDRIVWNQHHDPFEVLGPPHIEENGKKLWVVRAYLPNADSVSVVVPEERRIPDEIRASPSFF